MRRSFQSLCLLALIAWGVFLSPAILHGQNQVLGELQLEGSTDAEKKAGVWVDGQYLGYVQELKGSKKILLLPGEHEVTIRQGGYLDFSQKVVLQPAEKQVLHVTLQKDPRVHLPTVTAEVKLAITPERAAVFVDSVYVGHVDEFNGVGQALLVAPGKHHFKVSLPGYQTFESEVTLTANQKFQLKTDLIKAPMTAAPPP
jgi:hypothetical protein